MKFRRKTGFFTGLHAVRGWPAVFVLSAIVAFAGVWTLPLLDRDEARFAQATVQMLESGNFVRIRFQEKERNKKPAGIHWLQAASVSALSAPEERAIWAYRIPSVAGGILAALLVYFTGKKLYGRRTGLFAGLLTGTAPVLAVETTIAKTDAVLLALVCLSQFAFIRIYIRARESRRPRWLWPSVFWLSQGMAVLVKGPVGPLVSLLTWAGMWLNKPRLRWSGQFRPVYGLFLFFLVSAPWAVLAGLETQGRFYQEALGTDFLGKLASVREGHRGPPGTHVLLVWILFWPAAALILPGFLELWRARRTWQAVFLFSWLVPSWLMFELALTKLPHYTLPLYPALAIIAARCCGNFPEGAALPGQRTGAVIYAAVSLLAAALVVVLPPAIDAAPPGGMHYAAAAFFMVAGIVNAALFFRGQRLRATAGAVCTAGLYAWVLLSAVLPGLSGTDLSARISGALLARHHHPVHHGLEPVSITGYSEPSAVFLLGSHTYLVDAETAAHLLENGKTSTAIIERKYLEVFLDSFPDPANRPQKRETVSGLNYSNGQTVTLDVFDPVQKEEVHTLWNQ